MTAQVRALVQGKDHLGSTTVPLPRIAFQFEWSMCLQPARRRGRPEGRGHPDLSGPRKIRTRLGVDGAEGRRSRKASKLRLHGRHALDLREGSYSRLGLRSEEHTSELQSLMRHSYAVFCLKKKKNRKDT